MSSFAIRRSKKPVFRPKSEDFFLSENLKKSSIYVPPVTPKLENEIGFFEFGSLNLKKPVLTRSVPQQQRQAPIPTPYERFLREKIEEYQKLKKINEEEPECIKTDVRSSANDDKDPVIIKELSGNETSEECIRPETNSRSIDDNPVMITEISGNQISEECVRSRHLDGCDCVSCICPLVSDCCPLPPIECSTTSCCILPTPELVDCIPTPDPVTITPIETTPDSIEITSVDIEDTTTTIFDTGTIVMLSDEIVKAVGKPGVVSSGLLPALPNQRVSILAISDNIALLRILGPFQLNKSSPIFSLNDLSTSLVAISKFQNGECIWAKGVGITTVSSILYGSITEIDENNFALFISSNEDWSNFFEIINLNSESVQSTPGTSRGQAAAENYGTSVAARAILSNKIPQPDKNTFSFLNPQNYIPSFPVPTSRTTINEIPPNSSIGTRQIELMVHGARLESMARDAPSIQNQPPRPIKSGTMGIKINTDGKVLSNTIWTPLNGPISSALGTSGVMLAASGVLNRLKNLVEMRTERNRRRINSEQNINRLNETFQNNIASVEINANGILMAERSEPGLSGIPTPGGVLPPSAYLPRPNTINTFDIPKGGAIRLASQLCGDTNPTCLNEKIAPSPLLTKRNRITNNTALDIALSNQARDQLNNINIPMNRTVVAVHFLSQETWQWNGISPLKIGLSTGMTPSVGGIVATENGYGITVNVQTQNRDESFPVLVVNENVNRYMLEYPNLLFPTFWEQQIDFQRNLNFDLPITPLTNWVANSLVLSNNNFISLLSWIPRRNVGQTSRLPTLPPLQMRGVLISMVINRACGENGICEPNQTETIQLNWIRPLVWTLPRGVAAQNAPSPSVAKENDDGSILIMLPSSAPGVSLLRFHPTSGIRLWGVSIQGLSFNFSDGMPLISQTGYLVGRAGVQNVSVFQLDDENNLIQPPLVVLQNGILDLPRFNTGIPASNNTTRLVNMKIETLLPKFLGVVNQNQTISWTGSKTDGFINLSIGSFVGLNSLNEMTVTRERINTSFGVSIGATTMLFQS